MANLLSCSNNRTGLELCNLAVGKEILDKFEDFFDSCNELRTCGNVVNEWITDIDRSISRNAVRQNFLRVRQLKLNAAFACDKPTFAVVAVELLERDVEGGRGDTGDGAATFVGGLLGSQCVLALVRLGLHAPKPKKIPNSQHFQHYLHLNIS